MEEVKKKQSISISEVKELMEKSEPESMDQIQRWTYDYVLKFAKLDGKTVKKLKQQLVKDCGITEEEAVEIVNNLPTTEAELRAFTFGWKKLILAETLEKMLKIIKENV